MKIFLSILIILLIFRGLFFLSSAIVREKLGGDLLTSRLSHRRCGVAPKEKGSGRTK
jgi:hypothetical protein